MSIALLNFFTETFDHSYSFAYVICYDVMVFSNSINSINILFKIILEILPHHQMLPITTLFSAK